MIDPLEFVIIALAGWRLAYMLTNEDGPGDILGRYRRSLADPDCGPIKPGSLDKLWSCVYCMTFWTTLEMALMWVSGLEEARIVVVFLALWGAATALDMVARRD